MSNVKRRLPVAPRTGDEQTKAWFSAATEIINQLLVMVSGSASTGGTSGLSISGTINKASLGLDQVDNTRDISKPLSNPQQQALNSLRDETVSVIERAYSASQQGQARANIGILAPTELIAFDGDLVSVEFDVMQIGNVITFVGKIENMDASMIAAGTTIGTIDASLIPAVDFLADGLQSVICVMATGDVTAARDIAVGGVNSGSLSWLLTS